MVSREASAMASVSCPELLELRWNSAKFQKVPGEFQQLQYAHNRLISGEFQKVPTEFQNSARSRRAAITAPAWNLADTRLETWISRPLPDRSTPDPGSGTRASRSAALDSGRTGCARHCRRASVRIPSPHRSKRRVTGIDPGTRRSSRRVPGISRPVPAWSRRFPEGALKAKKRCFPACSRKFQNRFQEISGGRA